MFSQFDLSAAPLLSILGDGPDAASSAGTVDSEPRDGTLLPLRLGRPHVGDVGRLLVCLVSDFDSELPIDISAASGLTLNLERPDGSSLEREAQFLLDGSDGQIVYSTVAEDLDQDGYWYFQGRVAFVDGSQLRSDRLRVRVWKNNVEPD